MTANYYPPITKGPIKAILAAYAGYKANPDGYFKDAPWDEETKKALKDLFAMSKKDTAEIPSLPSVTDEATTEERIESMLTQIQSSLVSFQERFLDVSNDGGGQDKEGVDAAGMLAFFRVAVSLGEKLVNTLERTSKVKEYKRFKDIVIGAVGDIMTKDQLNTFITRINELTSR